MLITDLGNFPATNGQRSSRRCFPHGPEFLLTILEYKAKLTTTNSKYFGFKGVNKRDHATYDFKFFKIESIKVLEASTVRLLTVQGLKFPVKLATLAINMCFNAVNLPDWFYKDLVLAASNVSKGVRYNRLS